MWDGEILALNAGGPRALSALLKAFAATAPTFSWRATQPSHEAQGGGGGGGGGGRGGGGGGRLESEKRR